ncbi:MAG: type II secretion system F family protein [Sphaerimonospora mesophila]
MLTFSYTARDTAANKVIKSTVQAESEAEAAKLLMAQNIVPLKMEVETEKKGLLATLSSRVSTKDKVIFSRQLATLVNAGLPLVQSLSTIEEQTTNKALKAVVGQVIGEVNGGSSLADSFAKFPKVFDQIFIALVRAGEASGTLDKSLERLSDQQEHDADMMSKVKGAMVYPAIVLFAIVGVIVFMLLTVVPQVERLYADMGRELPFITMVLVGAADFVKSFWWLLIAIFAGAIFLLMRWIQTEPGRKAIDTFKLNVPVFSNLFRKLYMARFTRTLQTLLQSGVPMLEALGISSDAVNNVIVKEEVLRGQGKVKNGKALSVSLTGEQYILDFVPQMIKIGEQSGAIDTMVGKVADFYEKEVDNAIKGISTAIEPILMVCMAGMAGLLVGAILMPIYGLASSA